eukprot:XP_001693687.1 predicted protein [Chlamydomonas reinhardtii]
MSSRAIRPRPLNYNERLPVIFLNRPRDEDDDDAPEVEPALEEYLRNCEEEREREHALLSGLDSSRARKKNRLSLKKHQQLIDTSARSPPGKRHATPRNGLQPEAEPAAVPIAVPSCREVEDYDHNERAMAQADARRVAEAGPSVPLVGILLGTSPSLTTLGSISMDAASAYIIYQDVVRDQRAQPALVQYDMDEQDEKALAEMRKGAGGGAGGSSAKGAAAAKAAAAAAAAAALDERTFEGLIGALELAHFNALQQRKELWQETVKAGKVPKLPATERILPFDTAAAELREQQPLMPALPRALYNHWVKRRKQEGGPLLQYLWFEQPWKAICFRERDAGKVDEQGDMPFEATETKNSTRGGWNRLRIDKDEAYDRLQEVRNEFELLRTLADQVRKRERLKKQLHKLYRAEMASKLGFSIHSKHSPAAAAAPSAAADSAAAAAAGAAGHSADKKAGAATAAAGEPPSKRRKVEADQRAAKPDAAQQRKQAKGSRAEDEQPQPEKGRRGQGRRGARAAVEDSPPAPEPESSGEEEDEEVQVVAAGRAGGRGRGRQAPPPSARRRARGKAESSSEDEEEAEEQEQEEEDDEEAEPSSSTSSEMEEEDTSSEEADLKLAASSRRDFGRRWALAQQRTGRARNVIDESDGVDSSEPSSSGSEGDDSEPEEDSDAQQDSSEQEEELEEEEEEEEEPKTTRRQSQRRQAVSVPPPRSSGRQAAAAEAHAAAGGRRGRPRTRAQSASASLSPSPDTLASPSRSSSPTRSDRGQPSSSSPEPSRSPSSSPPPRGKRRGAGRAVAAVTAAAGPSGRQPSGRQEQAARGAGTPAAAPSAAKQVRFSAKVQAVTQAPKAPAGRQGTQQQGPKGRPAAVATSSRGAVQGTEVLVRGLRELQGLFKTSGVTEEDLLRADQHPGRGSPANAAHKAHVAAKSPAAGAAVGRGPQQLQQRQEQGQQQSAPKHPGVSPNRKHRTLLRRLASTLLPNILQRPLFTRHSKTSGTMAPVAASGPSTQPQTAAAARAGEAAGAQGAGKAGAQPQPQKPVGNAKSSAAVRAAQQQQQQQQRDRKESPANAKAVKAAAAEPNGNQRQAQAANKHKPLPAQEGAKVGPKPAAVEQLRKVRDGGVSKVAGRKGRPLLRDRNGLVGQGLGGGTTLGKVKGKAAGRLKG